MHKWCCIPTPGILLGDTKFLCKLFGHMSPASSYPCLWWHVQLKQLRKTDGKPLVQWDKMKMKMYPVAIAMSIIIQMNPLDWIFSFQWLKNIFFQLTQGFHSHKILVNPLKGNCCRRRRINACCKVISLSYLTAWWLKCRQQWTGNSLVSKYSCHYCSQTHEQVE